MFNCNIFLLVVSLYLSLFISLKICTSVGVLYVIIIIIAVNKEELRKENI